MNALSLPRPMDLWATADRRSKVWLQLCIALIAVDGVLGAALYKQLTKPPLVYRVNDDGIPQAVSLNQVVYNEPAVNELRSFSKMFGPKLMRLDSYAIVADLVDTTKFMTPEAYKAWQPDLKDLINAVQKLGRRTYIDQASLEISISKDSYPWRATIKGRREILPASEQAPKMPTQPFEVTFDLVTTPRTEENPWGILIHGFHTPQRLADTGVRQ